ncbi:hypothetical protein HPP92_022633 [Vanilla planifolia]|uniref:Uncharacterized protein n=1 Tax=Vanilla planifolia TaxID=51239 RepID=A0A835PPF1_VANPL|nr:hypothetical protein HPP92_022917 [Vanilla planifolia]KAG0457771.1 hypothetical protein HPP92_022928 [Vanilla planifolia]KAG0459505.1 hypothetical protein HPP92_022633 [Vanilla planifolia]
MGLTKASPASICADLRSAYHDCFNRWFSEKFSKGYCDKEECVVEWEKYRDCLVQNLEEKHLRSILMKAEESSFASKATDDSERSFSHQ